MFVSISGVLTYLLYMCVSRRGFRFSPQENNLIHRSEGNVSELGPYVALPVPQGSGRFQHLVSLPVAVLTGREREGHRVKLRLTRDQEDLSSTSAKVSSSLI